VSLSYLTASKPHPSASYSYNTPSFSYSYNRTPATSPEEPGRMLSRRLPNFPEKYFLATFCANTRILFHDDHFCDDLGAVFSKSKYTGRHFGPYFRGVCPDFQGFCGDFHRFCPDFHHVKTFESALAPSPPTPLIQLWLNQLFSRDNGIHSS